MKTHTFFYRGSQFFKMDFSEISDRLEEKGFNCDEIFEMMADENENVYVSDGFLRGLSRSENEEGEWHHYFKKDEDGHFNAYKLKFK